MKAGAGFAGLLAGLLGIGVLLTLSVGAAAPGYDVPERSDAELMEQARQVCETAQTREQPVLLEFSAPWCSDCRVLARLEQKPELARSLAQYARLAINVGRFDRHPELLQSFGLRAIAYWVVVAPQDCAREPQSWPRVASRTLEPLTGTPVRSDELATWLDARRREALELQR
jgi:thiol:disulfide interchange protein